MPNSSENTSVVALYDNSNNNDDASWDKASVISLVHPNTNKEQHFILSLENDIYEMTSISRPYYGSFFVGSRVISNGALHTLTRIDPLYFLLHQLSQHSQVHSWQPLDQLDVNQTVVSALSNESQWKHVCGIKKLGDDLILYKFSEDKALQWLIQKQKATVEVVKQQLLYSKQQDCLAMQQLFQSQGGGAFSNSFRLGEDDDDKEQQEHQLNVNSNTTTSNSNKATTIQLTNAELQAAKEASVDIVCEYLSPEWQDKLKTHFGFALLMVKESDEETNTTTNNKKRARALWEANPGQNDADDLLQFTMGTTSGESCKSESLKTKKKPPPTTAGLKRLQKVNTKGMKSLSSFFGTKKKKTSQS